VASHQQENTHFSIERGMRGHEFGTGFFVHKRVISAIKRVVCVTDRMSYIMLRSCLLHIIVLNVHAPTEDKTDYVKDNTHEELECIFDEFHTYHMKNFVRRFQCQSRQRRHF
jgi:hypothetical protein